MSEPQPNQPPTFTSFADWCLHNKDNLSEGARHTVEVLLKIAQTSNCNLASEIHSACEKLGLQSDQITDISPLSSLVNFKKYHLICLILSDNKITDISPLSSLVNLTELHLDINQITDISPLSSLVNLTSLYLFSNQITDISPLSSLVNLGKLYLDNNQITHISPLSSLVNLTLLSLSDNKITDISPLSSLVNLRKLTLSDNQITDLSPLQSLNDLDKVFIYGVDLPKKYFTHQQQWQAQWLLEEDNAEIRRLLIQTIGYERICQELQAIELDAWREYTLLRIDINVRDEPIYLLKMTCPSTGHIHVLRVPPEMKSAREAIRWVNWDIDPEEFAVQT